MLATSGPDQPRVRLLWGQVSAVVQLIALSCLWLSLVLLAALRRVMMTGTVVGMSGMTA